MKAFRLWCSSDGNMSSAVHLFVWHEFTYTTRGLLPCLSPCPILDPGHTENTICSSPSVTSAADTSRLKKLACFHVAALAHANVFWSRFVQIFLAHACVKRGERGERGEGRGERGDVHRRLELSLSKTWKITDIRLIHILCRP